VNHIPNIHELERRHGVTWGQLASLEPRLDELLWQARAGGARCRCREEAGRVFAASRNALAELVGFRGRHRGHPVLGSVPAYEVAYWRLYAAAAALLPKPPGDPPNTAGVAAAPRTTADRKGGMPMNELSLPEVPSEAGRANERRGNPSASPATPEARCQAGASPRNPVLPDAGNEGAFETFIGGEGI
jgi:hypothetical protein